MIQLHESFRPTLQGLWSRAGHSELSNFKTWRSSLCSLYVWSLAVLGERTLTLSEAAFFHPRQFLERVSTESHEQPTLQEGRKSTQEGLGTGGTWDGGISITHHCIHRTLTMLTCRIFILPFNPQMCIKHARPWRCISRGSHWTGSPSRTGIFLFLSVSRGPMSGT